MDNQIDVKIKSLLKELETASEKSSKYIGQELKDGEPIKIIDIYEMGLVYDNEQRLLMEFDKALSEKYSEKFAKEDLNLIKKQIERLTRSVRAWQNRQIPSEFRG